MKAIIGALILYIITSILLICIRVAFAVPGMVTFGQTIAMWIATMIVTLMVFVIIQAYED